MSANNNDLGDWPQIIQYKCKHGYKVYYETPKDFQLGLIFDKSYPSSSEYEVNKIDNDGNYEVALLLGTESATTIRFQVRKVGKVVEVCREYELKDDSVVKATYELIEVEVGFYDMGCIHGHVLERHRAYSIEMLKADAYTAFDVAFMMLKVMKD